VNAPSVTVITPTWQRHDVLLGRCVPSVQAQDYRDFEHLIVSDGPDPELAGAELPANARLIQLDDHDPGVRWGHRARLRGIEEAVGQVLAWLDDDDGWRPRHLAALAPATPAGGFAYSRAMVHSASGNVHVRIGDGPLARGRISPASMMVHDRQILELETWRDETSWPDWDLVRRWVEHGVRYASVDEVTVDYYPHGIDMDNYVLVAHRPL
jgi:glycosyltransferase involved in cell wall biosynthesis